jgi:hypothetical protein
MWLDGIGLRLRAQMPCKRQLILLPGDEQRHGVEDRGVGAAQQAEQQDRDHGEHRVQPGHP